MKNLLTFKNLLSVLLFVALFQAATKAQTLYSGAPQLINSQALGGATVNDFTKHTYSSPSSGAGTSKNCRITRFFAHPIVSVILTIDSGEADDIGYVGSLKVTDSLTPCVGIGHVLSSTNITSQVTIHGDSAVVTLVAKENCCCNTGWGSATAPGRKDALLHWIVTLDTCITITQDWMWAHNIVPHTSGPVFATLGGRYMATDASKNVYLIGSFKDSISFGNLTISGSHLVRNPYLVKYDSSGNVLWARTGSTTNNAIQFNWANGVTTDGSGNVYLTGSFQSSTITFGSHILTNSGGTDLYLVKYDANGNVIWASNTGGSDVDYGEDVATDAAGNVYLGGGFASSSITFGSFTLNSSGLDDVFLAKYDANGNVIWAKQAGGSDVDYAIGISTDASGNVYVFGNFLSGTITFGTTTLTNSGANDLFLTKYDASGNVVWAKKAGGTDNDYSTGITSDASGNTYITGYFKSITITFGSITVNNSGLDDIFIAKYDNTGTAQWAQKIGGASEDYGSYISADASGNVNLFGSFSSSSLTIGSFNLTNSGVWNDFLAKYNATGTALFAQAIGASNSGGIATDVKGNVVLHGGFIASTLTLGSITLTNISGGDEFIAKYGTIITNHCSGNDADGDGYTVGQGDCDDNNASIHPGAADICNGIDDNCNGVIDENAITATITPSGTVNVCSGTMVTLTANSGSGISYQWLKKNKNISGATNSTYATNKAAAYSVKESNSFSCNSTSAATTLNENPIPTATITPLGNLNICQTGSVVLQANAGTGLTYQWKKGSANISGATKQTYTATVAATYKVVVTNSSGCSKTSAAVKVTKSCREENEGPDVTLAVQLSLYPNPTNGNFTIDLSTGDELITSAKVQVMNLIGQVVYDENVSIASGELKKEISLDANSASGMYLVRVIVNDKIYSGQIVYQK